MSKLIVVDSSSLFSLFIQTDQNHNRAISISKQLVKEKGSAIVPSEIFSELINIVGKKLNHTMAIEIGRVILQSDTFTVGETSKQLLQKALEKFDKQPASVSFTDCLVMAFADSYETKEIFGFDETFQKNGYTRFGIDKQ